MTGQIEKNQIKNEIFEKVRDYYKLVHQPAKESPFLPGKSRVNYAGRVFDEVEMVNLVDSALDFWLTHGDYANRFEQALADYLGIRWALLVNSGSSANLLAFMALTSPLLGERQLRRKDEVITVAAGFPTTVAPLVQFGAIPVFVDVDLENCNIDARQLNQALSPRTRAVMLAHTLGNPFDLEKVKDFCEANHLWLIEDNCDALGSTFKGRKTGTWGDIGTSSFYPPHHMTLGEGGAVYTDNPLLKKIMLSMRDWGRDCWCASGRDDTCGKRFSQQHGTLPFGYDHKYVYSHFGYNLKATEMQAAVGLAQLEKLPSFVQKRKENFAFLLDGMRDLENAFILPEATPGSDPSWFGFLLTLRENVSFTRNSLVQFLENRNIQTRNLFAGNLTRHPAFETLAEGQDYRIVESLTNTDRVMNDSFWLGVYPGMKREALAYIVESVHEFLRQSR